MNELVRKAQTGGASDREALVAELTKPVKQLARYYSRAMGGSVEPEDFETEGWLYVLKQLPQVDTTKGNSLAHLYRHARYGMLDHLKACHKRHRREPFTDDLPKSAFRDSGEVFKSRERDFSSSVEWKVAAHNCVSEYGPKWGIMLEMLLAGLDGEEIGEMLGCTRANVSWYRKCLQRQIGTKLFGGRYV